MTIKSQSSISDWSSLSRIKSHRTSLTIATDYRCVSAQYPLLKGIHDGGSKKAERSSP